MTLDGLRRIEEIEARVKAATPGPWWYQERSDRYTHIVRHGENSYLFSMAQDPSGQAEADARFSAHVRSDVEWLLTELRTYRQMLSQQREANEHLVSRLDEIQNYRKRP